MLMKIVKNKDKEVSINKSSIRFMFARYNFFWLFNPRATLLLSDRKIKIKGE